MGSQNPNVAGTKIINTIEKITRSSFDFICLIGHGGFSKVWKVKWKKNNAIFALKEMSKPRIIEKKCENTILLERNLLSKMNHPFIVNMHFSFQDFNSLYLVMDLITGKDLRFHLSKLKKFTSEQSKFFLACTILGLEYLHYNKIIHRDIKPDNLVLDKNGYVKITDFGISRRVDNLIPGESSGTPGYMAPEVMNGKSHNFDSDYYCLGMMAYEFMKGLRPIICRSNAELKKTIMEKQIVINKLEMPDGWDLEAADFINRLIKRKQSERLGHGGDEEVKRHLWFKDFSWDKLYRRELQAPYIPEEETNKGINYTVPIDNEMMKKYKKIMNSKEYKVVFKNFLFFNLYDKNLYNEKYVNPHEIYEESLINNKNIIHKNTDEENKINKDKEKEKENEIKKNNSNINEIDNKENTLDIKTKSMDQTIKARFNYMNMFNRNNYNLFDVSQNIPNINKYLKNGL